MDYVLGVLDLKLLPAVKPSQLFSSSKTGIAVIHVVNMSLMTLGGSLWMRCKPWRSSGLLGKVGESNITSDNSILFSQWASYWRCIHVYKSLQRTVSATRPNKDLCFNRRKERVKLEEYSNCQFLAVVVNWGVYYYDVCFTTLYTSINQHRETMEQESLERTAEMRENKLFSVEGSKEAIGPGFRWAIIWHVLFTVTAIGWHVMNNQKAVLSKALKRTALVERSL